MPAGLGSAHLLIYVKRKPFCRSIIRQLQLFEVGACLRSEPVDLGMLLESEEKNIKHKKKEKNNTLSNSIFMWPLASGTRIKQFAFKSAAVIITVHI